MSLRVEVDELISPKLIQPSMIVFFVAVFVKKIELLSVLLGALSLKFSAYLQPLTNKLITKLNKGRWESEFG